MKSFIIATAIAFILSCLINTLDGMDVESPWQVGISGVAETSTGTSRGDMMMGNVVCKDQPRSAAFIKEIQNNNTEKPADFPLGAVY